MEVLLTSVHLPLLKAGRACDVLEAAWTSVMQRHKMTSAFTWTNSWHQLQPSCKRNCYTADLFKSHLLKIVFFTLHSTRRFQQRGNVELKGALTSLSRAIESHRGPQEGSFPV